MDTIAKATILPPKAKPVSLQRNLYPDGRLREENHAWLPYLADGVGKGCVGRDPMSIRVEVLAASGHPPQRTARLVAAFARGVGGDCLGLVQFVSTAIFAAIVSAALLRTIVHHPQLKDLGH